MLKRAALILLLVTGVINIWAQVLPPAPQPKTYTLDDLQQILKTYADMSAALSAKRDNVLRHRILEILTDLAGIENERSAQHNRVEDIRQQLIQVLKLIEPTANAPVACQPSIGMPLSDQPWSYTPDDLQAILNLCADINDTLSAEKAKQVQDRIKKISAQVDRLTGPKTELPKIRRQLLQLETISVLKTTIDPVSDAVGRVPTDQRLWPHTTDDLQGILKLYTDIDDQLSQRQYKELQSLYELSRKIGELQSKAPDLSPIEQQLAIQEKAITGLRTSADVASAQLTTVLQRLPPIINPTADQSKANPIGRLSGGNTDPQSDHSLRDEEIAKAQAETKKANAEAEKLQHDQNWGPWGLGLGFWTITVPILAATVGGIVSLFVQAHSRRKSDQHDRDMATSDFQLKVAELLMSSRSSEEMGAKTTALKTLFEDRLGKNFGDSFDPSKIRLTSSDERRELLIKLLAENAANATKIIEYWQKLFPNGTI